MRSDTYKAYRKFSSAQDHGAGENIVVRIAGFYIPLGTTDDAALESIELIAPSGCVVGCVTMRHLDRLGNANWAQPGGNRAGTNLWPPVTAR